MFGPEWDGLPAMAAIPVLETVTLSCRRFSSGDI